jgi:hypothetical protein
MRQFFSGAGARPENPLFLDDPIEETTVVVVQQRFVAATCDPIPLRGLFKTLFPHL